ncbi:MAG: hypothetical protein ACRC2N_11785 [Aeromonas sp.]|uniref:hypothetical protein n=1 Tax=Aeromonas jandaei TaxID=650 RepID=UPI001ABFC037|nr:hypothetical protein [Aeromonas jandaei]QSR74230.1 hypothetical protein GP488_18110 [Aeromonas jandaei]
MTSTDAIAPDTAHSASPTPGHTAFTARLAAGAHLLNLDCGDGVDLCWLRDGGFRVTACEPELALARRASRRSGQAVRVCPIAGMRSVLPYDGIWLSRPADLAGQKATDTLRHLATLLKPGALLALPVATDLAATMVQLAERLKEDEIPLAICAQQPAQSAAALSYLLLTRTTD